MVELYLWQSKVVPGTHGSSFGSTNVLTLACFRVNAARIQSPTIAESIIHVQDVGFYCVSYSCMGSKLYKKCVSGRIVVPSAYTTLHGGLLWEMHETHKIFR